MRIRVPLRARAAVLAAIGLLTAMLAIMSITPGIASATGTLQGDGTEASPYLISSDADLDTATQLINADSTANTEAPNSDTGYGSAYYELTTNLNYADDTTTGGDFIGFHFFSGTFNGNGYAISNMTYSATSAIGSAGGSILSFVHGLTGGTIENLTLDGLTADNTAQSSVGIAQNDFAGTISGVSLVNATVTSTFSGGFASGLVGYLYGNDYADSDSSAAPSGTFTCPASLTAAKTYDVWDGNTATITNSSVSGTISAPANASGLVEAAQGAATISDNETDVALTVTTDEAYAGGGAAGGLVASMTSGLCWPSADDPSAVNVAMSNNVVNGSITFSTAGGTYVDPSEPTGYNEVGAVLGHAYLGTDGNGQDGAPSNGESEWSASNNLVNSGFTFAGLSSSAEPMSTTTPNGSVMGTSISPQTLATEATYAGTATDQTDTNPPTAGNVYNQLGWDFSATPGDWSWSGTPTDGSPSPTTADTITLTNSSLTFVEGSAPSSTTVLDAAGASTTVGTLSLDDSGVDWSTVGTYQATVTADDNGWASSTPLTIVVVPDTIVPLTTTTDAVESSSTAQSDAAVLASLGATVPVGDGGTLAVSYPNGSPNWDTPGSYSVQVSDIGGADGLQPATATITVVAQPTVTAANTTVSFTSGTTVTASEVLTAADPTATYSPNDTGSVTANIANVGTAVGTYSATIIATDQYGFTSAPVTVTVAITSNTILLADPTPVIQATSTTPSNADLLSDLGAVLPVGAAGPMTVDVTGSVSGDQAVAFDTPGEYKVTVSDSNSADDVQPATVTLEIVAVSVLTVPNQTVYFNTANPATGSDIITASGAEVTAGENGLPVPAGSNPINVSLPQGCGTTAGSCTATLTGTDIYGFTTPPVAVTVDVSAAAVSAANGTGTFEATETAPSQTDLVQALGATVTGSTGGGTPVVDASGVDWSVPGTYEVTVSDSDADDEAPTTAASIQIVPVPYVNVPDNTIYLPASAADPLSTATLLANAGETLTDQYGNAIAGTFSADTSAVDGSVAGTYTATITGTDAYGFESAPVRVTVVIYLSAQQAGTVSILGTPMVGDTLTASLSGWQSLATPTYQWQLNGLPIPGATSATYTVASADVGQRLSVSVTEAPTLYDPATATSAAVIAQPLGGAGTTTPSSPSTPARPTTKATRSSVGNQKLMLTVPSTPVSGTLDAKFTSKATRGSKRTALRFLSVQFFLDKGVKKTEKVKVGRTTVTKVVYVPNATETKTTSSAPISLSGYAKGQHTLKAVVSYFETVLAKQAVVVDGKKKIKTVKETKAVTKTLKSTIDVA